MTTDVVTRQAVLLNADPDAAEIGNLYRLARRLDGRGGALSATR